MFCVKVSWALNPYLQKTIFDILKNKKNVYEVLFTTNMKHSLLKVALWHLLNGVITKALYQRSLEKFIICL